MSEEQSKEKQEITQECAEEDKEHELVNEKEIKKVVMW